MSRLFIAEKPSLAGEIAKCLPNPVKKDGYYETGDGKVTWAFGHMLKPADPGDYDAKYEKWNAADLPIIPEAWELRVVPTSKDQLKIIGELLKDKEVTEVIHGGDPDKEGQLVVDQILQHLKNKKPVKRILLNALDEKSVKQALKSLRNNEDFFNLQQCALARTRADWMIGMNFSRAFTLAAQRAGHQATLVIGRVKTPTLALVVRREREIESFVPHDYFIVKTMFQHSNGTFEATWKPQDTQAGLDSEGRLTDKSIAEELIKQLRGEKTPACITELITEQKKELNRLPFSLSALQIEAGHKFGYSPQAVLEAAQKLYEMKLTTYPRSDCDFLPENQFEDAAEILTNLAQITDLANWTAGADAAIRSRAWNDKKITAHHAIIPTRQACDYGKLSEVEKNIYFLVAQAYIAQFYPIHVYDFTKVEVSFHNELFVATGKTITQEGWKVLYAVHADEGAGEEEEKTLPVMSQNDILEYMASFIFDKTTKAPTRFTPSTLLKAMKEIHKFVKNEELKKQLKEISGIGTEATRATIIKELIDRDFMREDKKFLVPSEKAFFLIDLLPDELTYPDSTAEWEIAFSDILKGTVNLDEFLNDQGDFVSALCSKADTMRIEPAKLEGVACPVCGNGVLQQKKGKSLFWGCSCYPACNATYPDKSGAPDLEPPTACPVCNQGVLRLRKGKFGSFWGCTNRECNTSFDNYRNKPLIVKCPTCNTGFMKKKKGSKGEFFSCSEYPKCKTTLESANGKPVLEKKKGK